MIEAKHPVRRKPCAQCPFARKTTKEYLDTRGDNGERFIGQAIGPFYLPCHMQQGFDNAMYRARDSVNCAGAAIYRENIGVGDRMPEALGRMEADTEAVFASPAELLAHHRGITVAQAELMLSVTPPSKLLQIEVAKLPKTPHRGRVKY